MDGKKKKLVGNVISVRVSNDELQGIQEIMKVTRKSASKIMREAIELFIAQAS